MAGVIAPVREDMRAAIAGTLGMATARWSPAKSAITVLPIGVDGIRLSDGATVRGNGIDTIDALPAIGESSFTQAGAGAGTQTSQAKLLQSPINLYDFASAQVGGDCVDAMNKAIATAIAEGNPMIQVPDGVMLGRHVINGYDNLTIRGGQGVSFSNDIDAAGLFLGSGSRVVIDGFVDAVLKTHALQGGDIDKAHVFVGLAPGCTIGDAVVRYCSATGGRMGVSLGFENGRTLLGRAIIEHCVMRKQNGSDGGEGYAYHYANEGLTGSGLVAFNEAYEAGRHSFYYARGKGGSLKSFGNKAIDHRKNSPTKDVQVRTAFAMFRTANLISYGDSADRFFDSALMFAEENEAVSSPLNCDNVKVYGFTASNPQNVTAALWSGYSDPSTTATINNVLVDGFTFDSSLPGAAAFQYAWGKGVKLANTQIILRNITTGVTRLFVLQGNAIAGTSGGLSIEGVQLSLLGVTGSVTIMRPVAPLVSSDMAVSVSGVVVTTNTGGASVTDWEPSATLTNRELTVSGFSFPSGATRAAKAPNPSGLSPIAPVSVAWDPPSVAAAGRTLNNVTVTGAQPGDFALSSYSLALGGLTMTASVEAANTVTVALTNNGGSAVDLASGTLTVQVIKNS